MKYFSEKTNKLYDSEDELKKAELAVSEEKQKAEVAKQERAAAAKKVEDAFKAAAKANQKAQKALDDFTAKYGSFHKTWTGKDAEDFMVDPFLHFFDLMW